MEETIWVFKNFLSQIADAEERLDEYRTKIQAVSGAKMEIFSLINFDKKQYITPQDICNFCDSSQVASYSCEVIQRYFHFNKGRLNLDEFCRTLLPHNEVDVPEVYEVNTKELFIEFVMEMLKLVNSIEMVRLQLCERRKYMQKYFSVNYGVVETLNRKCLRQFMHEHNIYKRCNFFNICLFLYGECSEEISFQQLLTSSSLQSKKPEQKSLKPQNTKQISINDDKSFDINDVLEQIDNIEKSLKQKKGKSCLKKQVKICDQNVILNPNQEKMREGVGKIVSKKPIANLQSRILQTCVQERVRQPIFRDSSENYFEKIDRQMENRPFSRGNNSERKLRKSSAQAELKIQEIERRVMDKMNRRLHLNEMGHYYEAMQYRPVEHKYNKIEMPKYSSRPKLGGSKMRFDLPDYEYHFRPKYTRY